LNTRNARAVDLLDYYPLELGQTFFEHNIEEQAEMVQDRFRLRFGIAPNSPENTSSDLVTQLAELNGIIPL
jgi:hypothetical protein